MAECREVEISHSQYETKSWRKILIFCPHFSQEGVILMKKEMTSVLLFTPISREACKIICVHSGGAYHSHALSPGLGHSLLTP